MRFTCCFKAIFGALIAIFIHAGGGGYVASQKALWTNMVGTLCRLRGV